MKSSLGHNGNRLKLGTVWDGRGTSAGSKRIKERSTPPVTFHSVRKTGGGHFGKYAKNFVQKVLLTTRKIHTLVVRKGYNTEE